LAKTSQTPYSSSQLYSFDKKQIHSVFLTPPVMVGFVKSTNHPGFSPDIIFMAKVESVYGCMSPRFNVGIKSRFTQKRIYSIGL
jgi:hypothetical protein